LAAGIGKIPLQSAVPGMLRLLAVMVAVLLVIVFVPELALAPTR